MKVIGFLCLLASIASTEASCNSGWIDLGEKGCFHFGPTPMDWTQAQGYCNSLDSRAYLAEIYDSETNSLLAIASNSFPETVYWLGGSDIIYEVSISFCFLGMFIYPISILFCKNV